MVRRWENCYEIAKRYMYFLEVADDESMGLADGIGSVEH